MIKIGDNRIRASITLINKETKEDESEILIDSLLTEEDWNGLYHEVNDVEKFICNVYDKFDKTYDIIIDMIIVNKKLNLNV